MPYAYGSRAKSIGKNAVEGLAIVFSTKDEYDAHKRYFSKNTRIPVFPGNKYPHFYNHTQSSLRGEIIGQSEMALTDEGVLAITEYDSKHHITPALMSKADLGELYYSTGAAQDAYDESHVGNGVFHIDLWTPAEVSSTLRPADQTGRTRVYVSKSTPMSIEEADAFLRTGEVPVSKSITAPDAQTAVPDFSQLLAPVQDQLKQVQEALQRQQLGALSKSLWAVRGFEGVDEVYSFTEYLEGIGQLIDLPEDVRPNSGLILRLNEVVAFLEGKTTDGMLRSKMAEYGSRSKMGRMFSQRNLDNLLSIHERTVELLTRANAAGDYSRLSGVKTEVIQPAIHDAAKEGVIHNQVAEKTLPLSNAAIAENEQLRNQLLEQERTIAGLSELLKQASVEAVS